jgi:dihydrofolate reductase
MTAIRLDMTMSLDGFVAGPDDRTGQEMGQGGFRLFNWLDDRDGPGPNGEVYAESLATGAIISGRRTFELAGRWNGDHHDGVPIFVPTRGEPPEPIADRVHYVTDGVESAMAQAKQAAGDANVMVHGAELAQSLLRAGVLDEIEIHLMPLLLGEGRRLFDGERAALELTRVVEAPGVTHLRYRVAS